MGYAISLSRFRRILDNNKPSSISNEEYHRIVCNFILSELKSRLIQKLEKFTQFIPEDEEGLKDYNEWRSKHSKLRKIKVDLPILTESLINELTIWKSLGSYQVGFNPVTYYSKTGLRSIFLVKCIDYGTRYLKARHFFNKEFHRFQGRLGPKLVKFLKQELR